MTNKVTAFKEDFEDKGDLWPTDQPRRYIIYVVKPDGTEMTLPAMGLSVEDVLKKSRELYGKYGWQVLGAVRDN